MTKTMKAVIKPEQAPGMVLAEVPIPQVGPQDALIKDQSHLDLRHRSAHLQMGRVGAQAHPPASGRRP